MKTKILLLLSFLLITNLSYSQSIERKRPAEWKSLVKGARFIDRFLPMEGIQSAKGNWGTKTVRLRYLQNGIECDSISFWGGNILKGDDNKYHLFVCGWPENSPKGHMYWPNSIVYHTISENPNGPFKIIDTIGKGHNPEAFRLKDGRYVIYVFNHCYIANDINGPWEKKTLNFNPRDRKIIEGLSNMSFTQREDGSYLMVCRGGGIWISQDGESTYHQVTDKRVYPDVEGAFEDPVIWKDEIQYHLIVNDWYGRIAFYLRSKDGIHWVTDPGEAYSTGIALHKDGTKEDWFKFERIKILQDKYGRACQANFAVIDTLKHFDLSNDFHSSKNICIPLNKGLRIKIENKKAITSKTKTITLRIKSEKDFNPAEDIDISSLRFGDSNEVNFGRGATAVWSKVDSKDLLVTFENKNSGITNKTFAPKLIGKCADGKMLFGFAKQPKMKYIQSILSARKPKVDVISRKGSVIIENFGQVKSNKSLIFIYCNNKRINMSKMSAVKPYQPLKVNFETPKSIDLNKNITFKVLIKQKGMEDVISSF